MCAIRKNFAFIFCDPCRYFIESAQAFFLPQKNGNIRQNNKLLEQCFITGGKTAQIFFAAAKNVLLAIKERYIGRRVAVSAEVTGCVAVREAEHPARRNNYPSLATAGTTTPVAMPWRAAIGALSAPDIAYQAAHDLAQARCDGLIRQLADFLSRARRAGEKHRRTMARDRRPDGSRAANRHSISIAGQGKESGNTEPDAEATVRINVCKQGCQEGRKSRRRRNAREPKSAVRALSGCAVSVRPVSGLTGWARICRICSAQAMPGLLFQQQFAHHAVTLKNIESARQR